MLHSAVEKIPQEIVLRLLPGSRNYGEDIYFNRRMFIVKNKNYSSLCSISSGVMSLTDLPLMSTSVITPPPFQMLTSA
jgi:hypothetical protein